MGITSIIITSNSECKQYSSTAYKRELNLSVKAHHLPSYFSLSSPTIIAMFDSTVKGSSTMASLLLVFGLLMATIHSTGLSLNLFILYNFDQGITMLPVSHDILFEKLGLEKLKLRPNPFM